MIIKIFAAIGMIVVFAAVCWYALALASRVIELRRATTNKNKLKRFTHLQRTRGIYLSCDAMEVVQTWLYNEGFLK